MTGFRHGRPRRSAGFTLVELMISLVLSLIVMGSLIELYLSNTQAVRFQESMLRVQENGRFAIDLISRTARMAGYDDPDTAFNVSSPSILGTETSTGAMLDLTGLKTSGDTLGIRFEGGTQIRDCQGQAVAAGAQAANVLAISTANQLVCGTAAGAGLPLAEGIEDIEVLYGLDPDSDGIANRYVAAGNVGNWNQVVTMQVAILVHSVSDALFEPNTVCIGCSVFTGTSDRLIRVEFHSTIGVRN